jgi:hypothetical protein
MPGTRKAPEGKAKSKDNMDTTQMGMDGKYWHSKPNSNGIYTWFRGPAPDSMEFRDDMHPEIQHVMNTYWPTSVDTYDDYKKRCHLTKNLRCANGPGPGDETFCMRDKGGRCKIDQSYEHAKERRDALKDAHFRKQRNFHNAQYS